MPDINHLNPHHQQLCALAEIGAPRELIYCFLEDEKLCADHLKFLSGPIVQQKSDWQDVTPDWLKQAVFPERLRRVLQEHSEGKVGWEVGPIEITTVMQPATMEAPLSHDYANLYIWASAHANAYHHQCTPEELFNKLGMAPVTDDQVLKSNGSYYQAYQQLAGDIRRRVIKNAPSVKKLKQGTSHNPIQCAQLELFRTRD